MPSAKTKQNIYKLNVCSKFSAKIYIYYRNERFQSIEQDTTALKSVVDKLRTENYTVCMRLLTANEQNSKLREQNMDFRLENDKIQIQLKKVWTFVLKLSLI